MTIEIVYTYILPIFKFFFHSKNSNHKTELCFFTRIFFEFQILVQGMLKRFFIQLMFTVLDENQYSTTFKILIKFQPNFPLDNFLLSSGMNFNFSTIKIHFAFGIKIHQTNDPTTIIEFMVTYENFCSIIPYTLPPSQ